MTAPQKGRTPLAGGVCGQVAEQSELSARIVVRRATFAALAVEQAEAEHRAGLLTADCVARVQRAAAVMTAGVAR